MITPTKEQQDIITTALTGENLAINAFAGAAKTTTCILIAELLRRPSLYVAFNKSIANEVGEKFPFHVECRTLHSLAYENIVKPSFKFKKKLQNWFDKSDIDLGGLEGSPMAHKLKQSIVNGITEFCQSSYCNFSELIEHKPDYDGLLDYLLTYWNDLTNENHKAKITHDVYLKLFELSNPDLGFSVIYLDECQDSNPVTLSIILNQKDSQLILVGDKYQSIYEWRGAINAFDVIEKSNLNFVKKYLTESFRFTPEIASIAGKLLHIAGEDNQVIGRAELKQVSTKAVICRCNSTILSYLLGAEEEGKKVYCLADLKDLWSKMYHISNLYYGNFNKYPNSELVRFKDYKQLKAEAEFDDNLARLMKLTISLSAAPGLHANINKIKSVLVETPEEADFTLTTAHKSKGLEWDSVVLSEDLFYLKEDETIELTLANGQCLNLLYVAITRAKYEIRLPDVLALVLSNYRSYRKDYLNLVGTKE